MLGMMNIQWSAIEYVVLKNRKSVLGENDQFASEIGKAIKEGKLSNAVPMHIRLKYLKSGLVVLLLL